MRFFVWIIIYHALVICFCASINCVTHSTSDTIHYSLPLVTNQHLSVILVIPLSSSSILAMLILELSESLQDQGRIFWYTCCKNYIWILNASASSSVLLWKYSPRFVIPVCNKHPWCLLLLDYYGILFILVVIFRQISARYPCTHG